MAERRTILATGEFYHVLNRSVLGTPIFQGKQECRLFLESMIFYLQIHPPTKFSLFRVSRDKFKIDVNRRLVTIINYCLMPTHFHLTLRQEVDNGIQKYIQRLANSFAHYYGLKHDYRGPVFEGKFKAVHVENNDQLLHLSRYIHLNPVTAYIVERPEEYPFSSYQIYMREQISPIDPSPVLSLFSSRRKYGEFVSAQKEYQRELDKIKHLALE